MTPPKKPAKRSARIASVTSGATPPILTDAESTYLSAYRAMDDETREDATEMMQILPKRFPRAPRFRLVAAPSR